MGIHFGLISAPQIASWTDVEPEAFPAAAERYVLTLRSYYDVRARWHRRLHRLSGILLILIGLALPLISAPGPYHQVSLVAGAGLAVALLTSLRAFYRWDRNWILLRRTEMDITERYLDWKGSADCGASNPEIRRQAALVLLQRTSQLRRDEAGAFFKDLPSPETSTRGRTSP